MRTLRESMTAAAVAVALVGVGVPLALLEQDAIDWRPVSAATVVPIVDPERVGADVVTAAAVVPPGSTSAGERPEPTAPETVPDTPVAVTCPAALSGTTGTAPSVSLSAGAIVGTSTEDLALFARAFNAIRVEHCLDPVPLQNFAYDACMEQRLVWMAEDPSSDPASAWGHEGSVRSDGVPSVGCDGNLAGGSDNTGETVAQKWWDSPAHRASLFRPDIPTGTAGVCIDFAMTHGGIPNEPLDFTRAAARWRDC